LDFAPLAWTRLKNCTPDITYKEDLLAVPKMFLKKYLSKNLENVNGVKLGKIQDAVYSKKSGQIIAFIVKPIDKQSFLNNFPPAEGDSVMIPYPFFLFSDLRILLKEDEVRKFLESEEGEKEEI
jgi:sporulation protein YlmC with PRC-barrel domain